VRMTIICVEITGPVHFCSLQVSFSTKPGIGFKNITADVQAEIERTGTFAPVSRKMFGPPTEGRLDT